MTPSHPIVFLIDIGNPTLFARQGSYAHDPTMLDAFSPADVTIEDIADWLIEYASDLDLGPADKLIPHIKSWLEFHADDDDEE